MRDTVLRDSPYATELARAEHVFRSGPGSGRIERLRFKQPPERGKIGYRFSWWKRGRIMTRPLDATEDQLIDLMAKAIANDVFSKRFLKRLRTMLDVSS